MLVIFDSHYILLILTLVANIRPIIPDLKEKFKNIRKKEEKAIKEPVEKEEVLVVSCIGGIILTTMNDRILFVFLVLMYTNCVYSSF